MALVDPQIHGQLVPAVAGGAAIVGGLVLQAANMMYEYFQMQKLEEATRGIRDVNEQVQQVQQTQDSTSNQIERLEREQGANQQAQTTQHEETRQQIEGIEKKLEKLDSIHLDWSKPWKELLNDMWSKFVNGAFYLCLAILQICAPFVGIIIKGSVKITVAVFKLTAKTLQVIYSMIRISVIKVYRICKAVNFIVKNNTRLIQAIDEQMHQINRLTNELKAAKRDIVQLTNNQKQTNMRQIQRPPEIDAILKQYE